MIKSDLVTRVDVAIAQQHPEVRINKAHVESIVDAVFAALVDALVRREKIELRGFGIFHVQVRPPRKGRNPKTGTPLDVPAKILARFKPGRELKAKIASVEQPAEAK